MDSASLTELAQSMRPPIGIAQPILVRERTEVVDGAEIVWYEIVAGERRWRASEIAGLAEVPILIKQLTDLEVLTIQLIENGQREDLDELEEAEGYEKLMQQTDAEGNRYTANTIADAMGVSRATIYARLKLLDLCPEAREAFYAGELDASTALLIARIPVHKLQIEALKEVTRKVENDYSSSGAVKGDKALSYRKAREILQDRYMLDLADAPFDIKDAALVPKSGSCTDCTKRTGNQPELFDDVDGKNVCTDPVCHAMKKTAHVLALQKAAEEKGNKLLLGKDAKKLIPNWMKTPEEHLQDHGLIPLDAKVPGDEQKRTYGQILKEAKLLTPAKDTGKAAVAKTIVENPHRTNTMIETVNIEQATKALREAGFEITMKSKASPQQDDDKRAKEREKEKQELAVENLFRSRLFDTLHAQIEADMLDPNSDTFPKLYRRLAVQMWEDADYYDTEDMVALMRKYTTLPNEQDGEKIDWQSHIVEFGDNLPNLTPAQHLMLCIELPLLVQEISTGNSSYEAETMLEMAGELGIDAEGMRKEVAAEHKATVAAAKKAEKTKPKKAETAAAPAPAQKVRPAATWPFPTPN
ncbi:MAG: ParB/RepB/Spo0J family partition protein [Gallionellaceae bacterium]